MPTRKEEIAWAAGLFEGEGCVTEVGRQFTLKANNTDEWVIRRFAEIVSWGRTYGPYQYARPDGYRRKPFWVWSAAEESALDVMQMLAPWLSPRRLDRAFALTGLRFPVTFSPVTGRVIEPNLGSREPPPAA
jgi:hypothetical protein